MVCLPNSLGSSGSSIIIGGSLESDAAGLVFTTANVGNMRTTSCQMMRRALNRIGRLDIGLHDLRLASTTLAARAGVSLPELTHSLGQFWTQAATIHMRATADRGRRIAERIGESASEPRIVRPMRRRSGGLVSHHVQGQEAACLQQGPVGQVAAQKCMRLDLAEGGSSCVTV